MSNTTLFGDILVFSKCVRQSRVFQVDQWTQKGPWTTFKHLQTIQRWSWVPRVQRTAPLQPCLQKSQKIKNHIKHHQNQATNSPFFLVFSHPPGDPKLPRKDRSRASSWSRSWGTPTSGDRWSAPRCRGACPQPAVGQVGGVAGRGFGALGWLGLLESLLILKKNKRLSLKSKSQVVGFLDLRHPQAKTLWTMFPTRPSIRLKKTRKTKPAHVLWLGFLPVFECFVYRIWVEWVWCCCTRTQPLESALLPGHGGGTSSQILDPLLKCFTEHAVLFLMYSTVIYKHVLNVLVCNLCKFFLCFPSFWWGIFVGSWNIQRQLEGRITPQCFKQYENHLSFACVSFFFEPSLLLPPLPIKRLFHREKTHTKRLRPTPQRNGLVGDVAAAGEIRLLHDAFHLKRTPVPAMFQTGGRSAQKENKTSIIEELLRICHQAIATYFNTF